ncbi:MAG TPA: hypothetical protein VKM93_05700 [Terriglobia bacterium]|nr:hypothetical protein [Terriglobia bacterium]
MASRRMAAAAIGAAALSLGSYAMGSAVAWSPDHKLYAVDSPGQQVGKGQERERIEVFTENGEKTAVAHVWLVEPDGTQRVGIRGCEDWGWVDSTRLFCEGSINPNVGVYLVFDARSGRELRELGGTGFVWSPDHSRIADVGDARDLGTVSEESTSIEIDGKAVFPSQKDTEVHRFRSGLVWSPDSRQIAVVDQRQGQGSLYLVVIGVAGSKSEHKLPWQEKAQDWPPDLDYGVRWAGNQIIVTHGQRTQTVVVGR